MGKQNVKLYKCSQFLVSGIWWIVPVLFVVAFGIYCSMCYVFKPAMVDFDKDKIGVVVGATCGTSGFFIAVTGFFLALSKNNEITRKFFETKHPKYMLNACIVGLILSFTALILYLLFSCYFVVILIDIAAIGEFFVVLYYIFHLFRQYIAVDNTAN